jgi:antitoxin component YwqK of YwqJK toxin-antitoxin module
MTSLAAEPARDPSSCPQGTKALVERHDDGEVLRSCVIPGKEYRTVPFRHGPYELTTPDGKVKLRGEWNQNQQHGLWRTWNANGVLRRELAYDNGVVKSDQSWDDEGHLLERRDPTGVTTWYPNGVKQSESKNAPEDVVERRTWFANGKPANEERKRGGQPDGLWTEWFESGKKKQESTYQQGKLTGWKGWSSNGASLRSDACIEHADCTVGIRNECYRCAPPYEAITRWRAAQRLISPLPPPEGCDPGPFPCMPPPPAPNVECRKGRCEVK